MMPEYPTTRLSIIIASSGRPTLERTLRSIYSQTVEGDEVLVSVNTDCPWGNDARKQLMPAARGDALLFMDDDDVYVEGALEVVRRAVCAAPGALHIFRMQYADGRVLWRNQSIVCGNVSTQMFATPHLSHRASAYGVWEDCYEGDFYFISDEAQRLGEVVWHEETIARVRPV